MNISKAELERLAESLKDSWVCRWGHGIEDYYAIRDILLNPPSVTMGDIHKLLILMPSGVSEGKGMAIQIAGWLRSHGMEVKE